MWTFLCSHLFPICFRRRGRIVLSLLLLVTTTLLGVLSVESTRLMLQSIRVLLNQDTPGAAIGWLNQAGFGGFRAFVVCSVAAVLIPLCTYVLRFYQNLVFERIAIDAASQIRIEAFRRILRAPYERFTTFNITSLQKRITHDTGEIRQLMMGAGFLRLVDVLLVIAMGTYMVILAWQVALVAFAAIGLYFFGAYLSARWVHTALKLTDSSLEELSGAALRPLYRFLEIKSYLKESFEEEYFERSVRDHEGHLGRSTRLLLLDSCLTGFLSAIGPVLVVVAAGMLVLKGVSTLETLMILSAVTSFLYGPVDKISAIPITARRASIAIDNLNEILNFPEEAYETGDPLRREGADGVPAISCREVEFVYPATDRRFQIPSLTIAKGTKVAIVGRSGIGKSTFFKILFRLYPEFRGEIRINGQDLRDIGLESLRRTISWMSQDNVILDGTIGDNVRYGLLPGTACDLDGVEDVLRQASFLEDVNQFDKGQETLLSSTDTQLSGGQKRRLSLARSLMKRPSIFLMDEPLAGLSGYDRVQFTELIVRREFEGVLLVITHHEEILEYFDQIVFMDAVDGVSKVVAVGTHQELQRSQPTYRELFAEGEPS